MYPNDGGQEGKERSRRKEIERKTEMEREQWHLLSMWQGSGQEKRQERGRRAGLEREKWHPGGGGRGKEKREGVRKAEDNRQRNWIQMRRE